MPARKKASVVQTVCASSERAVLSLASLKPILKMKSATAQANAGIRNMVKGLSSEENMTEGYKIIATMFTRSGCSFKRHGEGWYQGGRTDGV